jgi:thioredoxin-related protein
MKRFIVSLIIIAILSGCAAESKTILLGEKAPFTKFTLMDGSYKTTANYKGKYLVILFWATTCARAHSTLDEVAEWARENSIKRNVRVVSVNIDKASKEDAVKAAIESINSRSIDNAFSGNDYYDEAYMAYDVGELPTLVLIDPTGKIIGSGDSIDDIESAFPTR